MHLSHLLVSGSKWGCLLVGYYGAVVRNIKFSPNLPCCRF